MEMVRSFFNPPDHVFVVRGRYAELAVLEEISSKQYQTMITNHPLLTDGDLNIWDQKFSFSDANEAMRFKLSIP